MEPRPGRAAWKARIPPPSKFPPFAKPSVHEGLALIRPKVVTKKRGQGLRDLIAFGITNFVSEGLGCRLRTRESLNPAKEAGI